MLGKDGPVPATSPLSNGKYDHLTRTLGYSPTIEISYDLITIIFIEERLSKKCWIKFGYQHLAMKKKEETGVWIN